MFNFLQSWSWPSSSGLNLHSLDARSIFLHACRINCILKIYFQTLHKYSQKISTYKQYKIWITCLLKLEGGAVVCGWGVGGGGWVGGAVLVVVWPDALKPSPPEDARREVGLADDADIERCTPRWEGDAAPAPPETRVRQSQFRRMENRERKIFTMMIMQFTRGRGILLIGSIRLWNTGNIAKGKRWTRSWTVRFRLKFVWFSN